MMTISTAESLDAKDCSSCGESKPLDEVDGCDVCNECYDNKDHCEICDEYFSDESCRHIGWVNEVGLCGCGSYTPPEQHKESFFALLKLMEPILVHDSKWNAKQKKCVSRKPQPLLKLMRDRIANNDFWTCWHGSMLGPSDLALNGKRQLYDISSRVMEAWGYEAREDAGMGMAWLCSLDEKTKSFNKLTAGWIDEFLTTTGR